MVARSLARAFLAGQWSLEQLFLRGRDALGHGPKWLHQVAAGVIEAFSEAPLARYDELAILIHGLRQRASERQLPEPANVVGEFDPPQWPLKIQRQHLFAPRMGERRWDIPEIATTGELAGWIGLTDSELEWLSDARGLERLVHDERLRHFHYHWVQKRGGGARLIESPKARRKALQHKVLREILERIPPHESAHGFRRDHSVIDYVAPHVGKRVVLRMDLRDFFATIGRARVRAIFSAAGYPRPVATVLAALCTNRAPEAILAEARTPQTAEDRERLFHLRRDLAAPHLPQGAPTSPALANLCAFRLDIRIAAAAERAGASYTRYADDLAFSGGEELRRDALRFLALASAIAMSEGFSINFRKSRVMASAVRQRLAGVVVNQRTNLARDDFDRLKATLHNCARKGPWTQNHEGHRDFRAHLEGRVGWLSTLNPERGEKLAALLANIDWSVPADRAL